jgi:hypothetical protein
MRRLLVLVVCCAALLVAGCGERSGSGSAERTPTSSPGAAAKTDGPPELTSIRQLQRVFDARRGAPRLVILLSPT